MRQNYWGGVPSVKIELVNVCIAEQSNSNRPESKLNIQFIRSFFCYSEMYDDYWDLV